LVILGTFYITQAATLPLLAFVLPPHAVHMQSYAYDGDVLSLLSLASGSAALLMIAFFAAIRGWRLTAYAGYATRPRPWSVLIWVAVSLGLGGLHTFLAPAAGVVSPPEFMVKVWASTDSVALLVLGLAVMAPVFEETFFRGFLYTGWGESLGFVWTASLTTLLWTVIHVQYGWYELVYIAILGILLATARFRTNSLWTPLWMHAANNGMSLIGMAIEQTKS
jgi:membrane protease YdiL (CAAX protease family)